MNRFKIRSVQGSMKTVFDLVVIKTDFIKYVNIYVVFCLFESTVK